MNTNETYYSNYYPASRMLHGSMRNVMGTTLDVLLFDEDAIHLHKIWNSISKTVSRLYAMLNRFSPESEISHINQWACRKPVTVSSEVLNILTDCKKYYEKSLGYFDVTLHDFSSVQLDIHTSEISFAKSDLQLDLGGYAKGYTLERIREILTENHIEKAFVNFGNSSVLTLGNHPYGDCWQIGIVDPYHQEVTINTVQLRKDETLSVSGNSPQRKRHIKNPFTGLYNHQKKLVSVIASNAIDAEVLSTAFFVCPADKTETISAAFRITDMRIYDCNKIDVF